MSLKSNRINLKYDPYLFKWTLDRASWDVLSCFRNIFFSISSKVQNVLPVKDSSLFSFFNALMRKCALSLQVLLFINSVKNRCISNTWSAFNWQHFLLPNFLRLNDLLFAPLNRSLVGMYIMNEKKASTNLFLLETISLLSLPANSEELTHIPREVRQEVIFVFLQLRTAQHIKRNLVFQVVLLKEDEVRDDKEM